MAEVERPIIWRTIMHLSLADLLAERALAVCSILALAAVLAPLVILAGLRNGLVQGLREVLLENPHAREIVTVTNRDIPVALLAAISRRPDVQVIIPRTRTLSSSVVLQNGMEGSAVRVELIPTIKGDPLVATPLIDDGTVVLSTSAAARLHALVGSNLIGHVNRSIEGRRESQPLELRVIAVAEPAVVGREAAFVTLSLAALIEEYQEGAISWQSLPLPVSNRSDFAGFRLYARTLIQIPELDTALRREGLEISSHANEIVNINLVDDSIGTLVSIVGSLAVFGLLVSLGAGFWASVERKRVSLAVLRFLGFSSRALWALQILQAAILSSLGAVVGIGAAQAAALGINISLAGLLALHRPICIISGKIVLIAFAGMLVGAVAAALLAGQRAAEIKPWEGIYPR